MTSCRFAQRLLFAVVVTAKYAINIERGLWRQPTPKCIIELVFMPQNVQFFIFVFSYVLRFSACSLLLIYLELLHTTILLYGRVLLLFCYYAFVAFEIFSCFVLLLLCILTVGCGLTLAHVRLAAVRKCIVRSALTPNPHPAQSCCTWFAIHCRRYYHKQTPFWFSRSFCALSAAELLRLQLLQDDAPQITHPHELDFWFAFLFIFRRFRNHFALLFCLFSFNFPFVSLLCICLLIFAKSKLSSKCCLIFDFNVLISFLTKIYVSI